MTQYPVLTLAGTSVSGVVLALVALALGSPWLAIAIYVMTTLVAGASLICQMQRSATRRDDNGPSNS